MLGEDAHMLDRPLIVEYWRDSTGQFFAEARHHPIAATGESVSQLKANISECIRAVYKGQLIPSVYDFVPRRDHTTERIRDSHWPPQYTGPPIV
jgi:hypothetical protein